MSDLIIIIIFSFTAGMSTLAGTFLVIKYESWTKKNLIFLLSLATGVILGTVFFDLLPEAIEHHEKALTFAFLSIIALYLLEQRIIIHSCHDEHCTAHHAKGMVTIFGLSLHSLIDGVIIGTGFSASPLLGIITSLGVIAHEIPEGVSIFSILRYNGMEKKNALKYSLLVAIATPIGALFSFLMLKNIAEDQLGIWLAFAAGSLLYIGASDLIPETHKKPHKLNFVFFILGAVLIYLISYFFKH